LPKNVNLLDVPHYMKKGAYKVLDKYKFEPDPETTERLCK